VNIDSKSSLLSRMLININVRRQDQISRLFAFVFSAGGSIQVWKGYAPFTEGWWHVYVLWMRQGRIPYKDFELLVPPGYPYLLDLVSRVVGLDFLSLRTFGLALMGLIGVLIYELIRPFCGRCSGVLISTTASVFIQSGTAFIGYDYVYFALAFVLGSFVFLQKALSSDSHKTLTPTHQLFLSGALMGCALSVKQTQGIAGISIGLFAVGLAYFLSDERGSIRKHCLVFSSGVVLVITFWLFWALVKGVNTGSMMSQIFPRNGTKGSTFEIFFGTERDVFLAPNFGILLVARQLLPYVFLVWVLRKFSDSVILPSISKEFNKSLNRVIFVGFGTLIVLVMTTQPVRYHLIFNIAKNIRQELDPLLTVGPILLCVCLVFSMFVKRLSWHASSVPLLAAAISMWWACGMSAGITEIGAALPLAAALVFLLYFARQHLLAKLTVTILCCALIATWTQAKLDQPYSWWGYKVSSEATMVSDTKMTSGLSIAPSQLEALHGIIGSIESVRKCTGEVVVYPYTPLFQLESDSLPSGRLGNYWYDFSSKVGIKDEISRLKDVKIKALVIVDLPKSVIKNHESLFNGGKQLPQRDLLNFLERYANDNLALAKQDDLGNGIYARTYLEVCNK
jgi:hypothetical protein